MTDRLVVLVTCGSAKEAERIARALVEARLAACGSVLQSPVRSIYRWKEKIEAAREFLLLIKTSRNKFSKLQAAIQRLHSYEVPEILALPIAMGSPSYLAWIAESLRSGRRR
jgi:periplasmic divalent cation tolerance protein